MDGIKVTSKHNGELLAYADAANRHEVTIGRIEDHYFGWYYVEEEENSYMGQMAEGDSLAAVIGTLEKFAREDFGLRYGRAVEMVDLLRKVLVIYPRD